MATIQVKGLQDYEERLAGHVFRNGIESCPGVLYAWSIFGKQFTETIEKEAMAGAKLRLPFLIPLPSHSSLQ